MDLKEKIGLRINYIRQLHDLTQEEFVQELNTDVTRSQLSRYESGENMVSSEFVRAVSETFKIPISWLLFTDEISDFTDDEISLVYKYRQLPEDVKSSVQTIIDSIVHPE